MSDALELLDDDALDGLLALHRRNLSYLEKQAAAYGGKVPLEAHNALEHERGQIARLLAELRQRGIHTPSTAGTAASAAHGEPLPLPRATGSPFVVGRPLRPSEPIFGRDAAFRFIAAQLARFSSVNIIGERRMGKTSLLHHLLAHQSRYLPEQVGQPPVVLVYLDLLDNIMNETRFYGTVLRELLAHLPAECSARLPALAERRDSLALKPEADYDQFRHTLRQLRSAEGAGVFPIVVIDEFERLLEPALGAGFPYPTFYDGIRSLIGADLLAMIVASRLPLTEYFSDPTRPNSLTSKFPTYFIPCPLEPLDDPAADALLLQPSDHPLTLAEVEEARRWAAGHPCHLQVAGQALYEMKAEGHASAWASARRTKIKEQNCMVGSTPPAPPIQHKGWLKRALKTLFGP